jgi:REP element-mobilizing transposase RayT
MGTHRRLPGVDYGAPGCYFVTIVTAGRWRVLGRLTANGVRLSAIGRSVVTAWENIGHRRPWVSTGEFCVMPDHCHGLISWGEETAHRSTTISTVVNGFKGEATRLARRAKLIPVTRMLWQRSFDVRFVVNERWLRQVEAYIRANAERAWIEMGG